METELQAVAAGGQADGFTVTYDDLHGLWGGTRVTVDGLGRLEVTTREPGKQPVTRRTTIGSDDVRSLAQLLVDIRAWEQLTPDAAPVPDESRATLAIRCGGEESTMWERFNDLARNGRLSRVRERLVGLGDGARAPGE